MLINLDRDEAIVVLTSLLAADDVKVEEYHKKNQAIRNKIMELL